jgi:hypothetical protein
VTTPRRWTRADGPEYDGRTVLMLKHLETRLARIPRLRVLLAGARECSDTYSGTATASEDAGRRAEGGPPSDPTYQRAVDPARWAARSAVRQADAHLLRAIVHLQAAEAVLTRGLARYERTYGSAVDMPDGSPIE